MDENNVLKGIMYSNDRKSDLDTILEDLNMFRIKLIRENKITDFFEHRGFNSYLVQLQDSVSNSTLNLYAHTGAQLHKNLLVGVAGPKRDELYAIAHEFLTAEKYFIITPNKITANKG